jgi:hypothetical protein
MKNNQIKISGSAAVRLYCFLLLLLYVNVAISQEIDSSKIHPYKNIIRYNLSGALLFGPDRYVIFGYERVINRNQSISINIGSVSLPRLATISTDSLELTKDNKNTGTNFSIDYRFYLGKENKYPAPHGVYIGPYYSFNHFKRDNEWDFKNSSSSAFVNTNGSFTIHTAGLEFGYQFIFWKRLALDMVLVGPGIGFYDYKVKFEENVDEATKEQLRQGLQQLLTQKFPGMNYVFSEKEINGNGALKTTSVGYRYMIHIGFNF